MDIVHVTFITPANRSSRLYRASIIKALNRDLKEELQWTDAVAIRRSKNYQVWQHRQTIVSWLSELPDGELDFLSRVLEKDAKNYHVWSYRQWLVKQFGLWAGDEGEDGAGAAAGQAELAYAERMIEQDVRNNSAWNHRYFVLCRKPGRASLAAGVVEREVRFAQQQVRLAPQNQSSWNYLRGVLRFAGRPAGELEAFALGFADVEKDEVLREEFKDQWVEWSKQTPYRLVPLVY